MNHMVFSELEFAAKKKRTRRERFLGQIEAATPWALLVEEIEPFYPKGERGRPPIGIVADPSAGRDGVPRCRGVRVSGRLDPSLFSVCATGPDVSQRFRCLYFRYRRGANVRKAC